MPDNEVIDPSRPDFVPVKPKTKLIYFIALMAGIGIPFLWILIADTFNNKVRERRGYKENN